MIVRRNLERILLKIISQEYEENAQYQSNNILRSIEFAPEYHQVGLGILNYFSKIISQKYPDVSIRVKIEQENLTVRMIIETLEGEKEILTFPLCCFDHISCWFPRDTP